MELTRCPQLNDLIRCVQQYQQGVRTEDEIKNNLRQMESLYKVMWAAFQRQLRVHDKTTALFQFAGPIEEHFRVLRHGLETVRSWFSDSRPEHLYDGLDESRTGMEALLDTFDKLTQAEQNEPRYSENPFLNEVIRVGHAVIAGRLAPDVFKDVLQRMKSLQKETAQQILNLPTAGDDDKQLRGQVRGLMERVYAGLKEAEEYFTDQRTDHIQHGLDSAQAAMKELYEVKAVVESKPPTDAVRTCWRCKKDVAAYLATCDACGFRFPVTEEAAAMPIPEVPTLRTPNGHTASEVSERVVAAVEEVQLGGPVSTLMDVVADIKRRVGQARGALDRVPGPALNDVDQTTAYQEQQVAMSEAFDLMEAGAHRLGRYDVERDPDDLTEGLEMILLANDQLMELQQVPAAPET